MEAHDPVRRGDDAAPREDADSPSSAPALFVAPDLEHFENPPPIVFADDVTIGSRPFRRLDPPYFAWLRHKMTIAKRAVDVGRLPAGAFAELRRRFEEIATWARAHIGEPSLRAALASFDARTYQPPRRDEDDDRYLGLHARVGPSGPRDGRAARSAPHLSPDSGSWRCTEPVTAHAVHQVDAIREEALALGWPLAALYQNRADIAFPCGGSWGLVTFVREGTVIERVTPEAIHLRHLGGTVTTFPNRAVHAPHGQPALEEPATPPSRAIAPLAIGAPA